MSKLLFYQWLAGLFDGDGNFHIKSDGECTASIVSPTEDLPMLEEVKDFLGEGKMQCREDKHCYVLNLYKREVVIKLLNNLNGLIYNSVKFAFFSKMCIHLGIVPIKAIMPDISSPYYAGFFDADGTIGISVNSKGNTRIMLSVTNKYKVDVELLQKTFGGSIYESKRLIEGKERISFVWKLTSKVNILRFLKYYKSVDHFKSFKSSKFLLIEEYYELKALRAWKEDSVHYPRWVIHFAKWDHKVRKPR